MCFIGMPRSQPELCRTTRNAQSQLSQSLTMTRAARTCARVQSPHLRSCACGSVRKVQALNPAVERTTADPEPLRGGRLVAADLFQHHFDVIALRTGELRVVVGGQIGD